MSDRTKVTLPITMRIDEVSFWRWAHSDFVSNAERGVLAEYIVGSLLDSLDSVRKEWNAWDLITPYGAKIEIKTSGYVQTWPQTKPSVIRFDISDSRSWHADTNTYDDRSSRSADIYVFCVHAEKERDFADPLDVSQWLFYVVSTAMLDSKLHGQKTVGISTLETIGCQPVSHDDLAQTVTSIYHL